MTVEHRHAATAAQPPLDALAAGVIEQARRRQRRHRRAAAVALLAAAAAGAQIGGGGGGARPGGGIPRHPMAMAASACVLYPVPAFGLTQGTPSRATLSILGVLRRPDGHRHATSSKSMLLRSVAPGRVLWRGPVVFARYVRLARFAARPDDYYLIVPAIIHPRCSERSVQAVVVASATREWSATPAQIEDGDGYDSERRPAGATIAMLVPDGIAAVTLRYRAAREALGRVGPTVTTSANAVDNLVLVTVPRGAGDPARPLSMTWHAGGGAIVRRFARL